MSSGVPFNVTPPKTTIIKGIPLKVLGVNFLSLLFYRLHLEPPLLTF